MYFEMLSGVCTVKQTILLNASVYYTYAADKSDQERHMHFQLL